MGLLPRPLFVLALNVLGKCWSFGGWFELAIRTLSKGGNFSLFDWQEARWSIVCLILSEAEEGLGYQLLASSAIAWVNKEALRNAWQWRNFECHVEGGLLILGMRLLECGKKLLLWHWSPLLWCLCTTGREDILLHRYSLFLFDTMERDIKSVDQTDISSNHFGHFTVLERESTLWPFRELVCQPLLYNFISI